MAMLPTEDPMTQGEAMKTTDSFFDSRNGEDVGG
jgi:hypothetical protein